MIINHSTSNEQSLYLIMKRLAGEHGSCYASLNWLANKMGSHKTTVSNTITKLLKRTWIKEVEPVKVIGGKVRQFIIVDIWKINIEEYKSGANLTSSKSGAKLTTSKKSGAILKKSGAILDESGAKTDTKKNYTNIYKEEGISSYKKKKKPFFQGQEMRKAQNKWWVLPSDGGQWLEFAGKKSEIVWKN